MSDGNKAISRIGKLREQKGLTQRELSLAIGVTENTIQNWESGRAGLEQIERLIRLCQVLGCELEDLIEYILDTEEGSQKSKKPSLSEIRQLLGTEKVCKATKTKKSGAQ